MIAETAKLWRRYHLTYDQARYVAKEVRSSLKIERTKTRKRVVERLSWEEEKRLIQATYRDNFPLMGRWAWVKAITNNRRTIFKLVVEAFGAWSKARNNSPEKIMASR